MVPADAVATVTASARARQHVAAGEILVAGDVAPTGVPQALIPPGWTAIAIAEAVPSGARVGDAVAVAASGAVLSAEGIVVGLVGDATLVAVPDADAAAVAGASAAAGVSLLLRPVIGQRQPDGDEHQDQDAEQRPGRRRTAGSCACGRTSACPTPRPSR